jgi:predicted nucleotidyltransferase
MVEKLDFITPTLMQVLELFFSDPMGEYHEREVMRRTRVSKGSANKMLRLLAREGFLQRQKRGRIVLYRLNAMEPAARQFKILISVFGLRPLVAELKDHARRIILFGSSAEGTDVRGSDIDVLVVTSEKDVVRRRMSEFSRKGGRKLAPIIVDANELVRLKNLDRPLYENIERGITLWETE